METRNYSAEEIRNIKYIVSKYHATDFVEPSFYLILNIICIGFLLFFIHTQKSYILLVFILALFLLRMFMMFHDLCHKSFFPTNERDTKTQGFNLIIAQCLEGFNFFEASYWIKGHSAHHTAHGNLNKYDSTRTVLTSSEYNKMSLYKQTLYDIFRNPFIFFLIYPLYGFWICKFINNEWMFLIKYTLFLGLLYYIGKIKLVGAFFIAQYIGGIIGLMLFHLQHQVNEGYWKRFNDQDQVSKDNAELRGSSVLKIPWILDFFTNGIEYHNIHHLDPGVPSYRTKSCFNELVRRGMIPDHKVGYLQAFQSLFHILYNEKTQRYESNSFFASIGLQG